MNKCYLRTAGLALREPKDSPLYGDSDGVILEGPIEGHEPTWEDGGWLPAKFVRLETGGEVIMAVRKGEEPEERDDWLEACQRELNQGVRMQFWIL